MRSLVLLLLGLTLLAAGAVAGFRIGRSTSGGPEPVVSPEQAGSAAEKLAILGERRRPVRLTASEITSLFAFRPELWSVPGLDSPVVRFRGDTVSISGFVDPAILPELPAPAALRRLLPDSTRLTLEGRLEPHEPGAVLVRIAGVDLLGFPFPSRFFPVIVERLGLPRADGLPPNAFELRLPAGISTAVIHEDALLLTP